MAVKSVKNLAIEECLLSNSPELQATNAAFQNRGKLFRPISAIDRSKDLNEIVLTCNPSLKSCRAQSAKGRLEKQNIPSVVESDNQEKKTHAVINLNLETSSFNNSSSNKLKKDLQNLHVNNRRICTKETKSVSSITTQEKNYIESIQPSVKGIKVKQKGEGDVLATHEVLINEQNVSYHDHNVNKEIQSTEIKSDCRNFTASLQPLKPWLKPSISKDIVGLDPSKCWIFLSHNYDTEDIPELPAPQTTSQNLTYTCVVETPRKPTKKRYKHHFISAELSNNENSCYHKKIGKINCDFHSSISNDLTLMGKCNVIQEIKELEDLLNGIISQNSQCAFVQFQDELYQAKQLATKLGKMRADTCPSKKETDSFGLLQLFREHEEIMKILMARRDHCLQKLSELCCNLDVT